MSTESAIYYWKDKYLTLKEEYDKLQELYKQQERELDKANYQIKTELEPRIASERRSYDCWVISQAEPKCACTLGCPYEDTDECLRKYEKEGKC